VEGGEEKKENLHPCLKSEPKKKLGKEDKLDTPKERKKERRCPDPDLLNKREEKKEKDGLETDLV